MFNETMAKIEEVIDKMQNLERWFILIFLVAKNVNFFQLAVS